MSFIQKPAMTGHTYEPGWFLADNEHCTRVTKTISATGIEADENGAKVVPMGTIYPANGATAIGIVYEDVDVTTGDMPGSVVTSGTVYEDRLAVTGESYDAATVPTGGNPKELGLYERSGTSPNYVYTLTTDTTAGDGKTYYARSDVRMSANAKTALAALGFKFITAAPTTTRPDDGTNG